LSQISKKLEIPAGENAFAFADGTVCYLLLSFGLRDGKAL